MRPLECDVGEDFPGRKNRVRNEYVRKGLKKGRRTWKIVLTKRKRWIDTSLETAAAWLMENVMEECVAKDVRNNS